MDQGIMHLRPFPAVEHHGLNGALAGKPLTIALINNMPDAALGATERQFCSMLGSASDGIAVNLKFYSPPQISRSPAARAHVARYYDDFSELEHSLPDGIIITGAEPQAGRADAEPLWGPLSRLVDWVEDCSIPSIWSCLAAHIALFRMEGIERNRFERKLSGVFECQLAARPHRILHGLPNRWRVPHSRQNGLREADLLACGFSILSRSRSVGADIFMRQDQALHLFFQGHPEYEGITLLREYRRDVFRFLSGERAFFPDLPAGYLAAADTARLSAFANRAKRLSSPGLMEELDAALAGILPRNDWMPAASRLYHNWISYLDARRLRSGIHAPVPASLVETQRYGQVSLLSN